MLRDGVPRQGTLTLSKGGVNWGSSRGGHGRKWCPKPQNTNPWVCKGVGQGEGAVSHGESEGWVVLTGA